MRTANRRPAFRQLVLLVSMASLGCGGGLTPDPELRTAWSEYYSTLVDVRSRLEQSRHFDAPIAQAGAYRYLTGLVSLHNRLYVHFGEPRQPFFVRWVGLDTDWGFSNPDQLHLAAAIADDGAYRIRGRLGSAARTTIASHRHDGERLRAVARLRGEDLSIGPDGEFELVVSAARVPGNWLPLEPGVTRVTVYQTFVDWDRETRGRFRIERIGEEGRARPAPEPVAMARRLTLAARAIRRYANTWLAVSDGLSFLTVNTLAAPERLPDTRPARWFVSGHYALSEHEALIVELRAPERADYWGFALFDAWSGSLDYANRQTSLNLRQASRDADGVLRLVLAARDPGVPNWLDTSGHPEGIMAWRVTSPEAPARPAARVVPLGELRAALPAGTPRIAPEQRRQILHRRQQHVARRYAN
jgi:hypothetical protein